MKRMSRQRVEQSETRGKLEASIELAILYCFGDEGDEQHGYANYTTMHIFDVSNLSATVLVNSVNNGNTAIDHNVYTKDHYIFQANYRSGLRVFDITDQIADSQIISKSNLK